MPIDGRVQAFTKWSNERGLVARDVDRTRVARELFEISDGSPVEREHIDALLKKYRDGLMGARSVLAAKRVGQELLEWQEEDVPENRSPRVEAIAPMTPPPPPPPSPNPFELVSSAGPELEPPPEPRPDPKRESTKPERKQPEPKPSPPVDDPPRRKIPDLEDLQFDAAFDDAGFQPLPPKPRRDEMVDQDGIPRSARVIELERELEREVQKERERRQQNEPAWSRRHQESAISSRPPPAPGPLSSRPPQPASRPPPAENRRTRPGVGPVSSRPPGSSSAAPPARGSSAPPSARASSAASSSPPSGRGQNSRQTMEGLGDIELDSSSKKFKQGFTRPISVRAGANLPELDRDEDYVDEERKLRARSEIEESVAPPPPPPAPRSVRPLPPVYIPEAPPQPFTISGKMIGALLSGVLIVVVVALVVLRPGCIFASSAKPVSGTFTSKHLHLAWEFPAEWLYAEDRDAEETTQTGWTRRSSVFFHGRNPNAFQSQIVVIAFDRTDKAADEEDARQLGGNETLNNATRRRCEAIELHSDKGTRCFAIAMTTPGQPLGVIEMYFPVNGRAIFTRFSFELPGLGPPAANPEDQERQSRLADEQLQERLTDAMLLVESIRPIE